MNFERFAAIRLLFEQVVDLSASDREARLRALTSDATLVDEVIALCKSTDRSTTHFAKPLNAMLQSAVAPTLKPGDSLGVWRIKSAIGEGGMGSVFLVERDDGHFKQTAALKFVKGLPRADTLAYFTRERQLLATLAHPNIARLFDGGASPAGQPYLVMEYVDGLPIDVYCRQQQLGTTQILHLFAKACAAVAFAHRQLVVHCDLKPSNLLVDKADRPVLLDFGIATLMERVGAAETIDTVPSGAAFTPRYASPEQRDRGVVSTASDIYSLGVLLGELLEAAGTDIKGGVRARELAAILGQATQHEPAQRYASVDAFTADIARYLNHEPVQALPQSPAYRAHKLLVRRWPVALAALAFVVMAAGFTLRLVDESRRAQAAEQQALTERDRAQAAQQIAVRERDATRLAQAEVVRERDSAQVARNEAVQERDRAAAAEKVAAQQRDRARLAEAAAVAERDSARRAEAAAVAERNRATQAEARSQQTSDFLVSVFEAANPNAESGDIPASRLIALAGDRVEKEMAGQPETQAMLFGVLGKVQSKMGNSARARDDYLRAIAIERKLDRPLVLAKQLHDLAMLRISELGTPGAEAELREALALQENHAPGSVDVANMMGSLGHFLSIQGKTEEGGKLLYGALALHDAANPQPEGTGRTLIMLAQHSMRVRDHDKAIAQFRRGVEFDAARKGAEHPTTLSGEELFVRALMTTRKLDEAEERARRVLALRRKQDGNESSNVGTILNELGRVMSAKGKLRDAIGYYEESRAIHAKRNGTQSTRYALMLNNIGVAHMRLGNLHKTAELMQECVAILDKAIPGEEDLGKAGFVVNLGIALVSAGRHEEALVPLGRAHASRKKSLKDNDREMIESELYLADAELHLGRLDQAVARLGRVGPVLADASAGQKFLYRRLNALVEARRGNLDAAISQLTAVDEERFKQRDSTSVAAWTAQLERAELLLKRNGSGDRETAGDILKRVIAKLKDTSDPDAPPLLKAIALQAGSG